jgi:hypothetical protein
LREWRSEKNERELIERMNPVGEFRISDAEGASLRLADAGETLRLQYHWVTHLWRVIAKAVHRRGKPLLH